MTRIKGLTSSGWRVCGVSIVCRWNEPVRRWLHNSKLNTRCGFLCVGPLMVESSLIKVIGSFHRPPPGPVKACK